jgi:hypothetical protein
MEAAPFEEPKNLSDLAEGDKPEVDIVNDMVINL